MEEIDKTDDIDDMYDRRRPRRQESVTRDVNLDDMCYASLKAVVKADSSRDALEKYLSEYPVQILRNKEPNDNGSVNKERKGYHEVYSPESFSLKDYKITRVYIKASYGALRNFDVTYEDIQLTPYKVSCADDAETMVWVYQMGGHWVICS